MHENGKGKTFKSESAMRLIDIIQKLDELDDEDVIFVRPDWTPDSEAALFRLTEDDRIPEEPIMLGLKYLLGVESAREVLEDTTGMDTATVRERCERIIDYAINDA